MSFYLKGGPGRWSDLFLDRDAVACVLVDVNAAGRRYNLGTMDVDLVEMETGRPVHFVGAILNDPAHSESFDPFSHDSSVQAMKFKVMGDHFPIRDLRKAGVLLQDVGADVYWFVARHDYSLDQAFLLIRGRLTGLAYDEEKNVSTFRVEDARLRGGTPFPPVVATQDRIPGLLDEHSGKPYPVVIGSVKKLPLLDISNESFDDFLVMQDKGGEWPTALPPVQVDGIYDGDATLAEAAEASAQDADGNAYLHVTTGAGSTTRDVTANVTGHLPATLGEAVRFLLTMYGDDPNVFDVSSVDKLDLVMGGVTLALAFNARVRGGVLDAIRDRLSSLLPFGMVQRGAKYAFEPFTWDRDVVKHLRTRVNIVRKTRQPAETRRSELYNSFSVRYGRSGLRGDSTGCVVADENTSDACRISVRRYGRTQPMDVDAGDLADAASARWLLNWLVETFAKMRVHVGYRCTLDAVNVRLIETVMVTDEDEEWEETLFKVVKVRRRTGPWIDFDLVSVDDYTDVYGVNE